MNSRCFLRTAARLMITGTVLFALPAAVSAQGWERGERPSRAEVPLPKNLHAPVVKATAADPTGDTFGVGGTQLDITELTANVVGNNLVIGITFNSSISAPDSGEANAIDGFIDLDTDQDGNTGIEPWVEVQTGNPTTGMGDEFHVDIFEYNGLDSTVELVDDRPGGGVVTVPVAIGTNSVTVTIPLADLGNDDGAVNVAAVMGTPIEPTDVAPNQGSLATEGGDGGNPNTILLNGRFEVGVEWRGFETGQGGFAQVSDLRTPDSAIMFFGNADNLEFLIKVIDGCDINDRFWVFFAGATNVEFTVSVTDTQTNTSKEYSNPLGNPADAVTDTQAFATCP